MGVIKNPMKFGESQKLPLVLPATSESTSEIGVLLRVRSKK